MENYWGKTKELLLNPKDFFKSVKKEKDYLPILIHIAIFWVASQIILSLSQFAHLGVKLSALSLIIGILMGAISAFIFPFIGSAVVHIGVLILGGKKGFFNTFKPASYTIIIALIYNIVATILSLILSSVNETIASIAGLIILAIMIIHYIVVEVIGISFYQDLSKGKSFVAVVIVPLFFYVFLFIILAAVFGVVIMGFSQVGAPI